MDIILVCFSSVKYFHSHLSRSFTLRNVRIGGFLRNLSHWLSHGLSRGLSRGCHVVVHGLDYMGCHMRYRSREKLIIN